MGKAIDYTTYDDVYKAVTAFKVNMSNNEYNQGEIYPFFISANVEGGDRHNAQMLAKYKDRIFYMGH